MSTLELKLCFNCDAGGSVLSEEMLRETLKGAQEVRQEGDPKVARWEWRAAQEVIDGFNENYKPSKYDRFLMGDEAYRALVIKADPRAKNNVYLVDKDGDAVGLIKNLGLPENPAA